MNERIRELADQAAEDMAGLNIPDEFCKKFAELIVAECIEVLRLVPYNSDRDFGDEAIYQEAIDKHFGVEE
jgi:hypothetical protein